MPRVLARLLALALLAALHGGSAEPAPGEPPAPEAAQTFPPPASPEVPDFELPGEVCQPEPPSAGQVWVRGGAGAGPGQFGLQGNPARDDEDALGPPTFALGPQGSLWVLDPVNARLERFDARGQPAGAVSAGSGEEPTFEADLAVNDDGQLYLFQQGELPTLSQLDPGGRLLLSATLPPAFKGVDLLFAGRQRPVFLMLDGQAVRAELAWGGVRADGPLPGLPVGSLFVRADRLDRWRARFTVLGLDGQPRRSLQFHSLVPIGEVRIVGVSRRGEVVLAFDRRDGAADPGIEGAEGARAEVLLLAIDAQGQVMGTARVPPGNRRFEFREFALAADGTIVQMQSDVGEVRFVRWTLRPLAPAREPGAGRKR